MTPPPRPGPPPPPSSGDARWPDANGPGEVVEARSQVGLDDVAEQVASILARRQPGTPCIVGPAGRGRTTALGAVAGRLDGARDLGGLAALPVVRVRAETVLAGDRSAVIRRLREQARRRVVLALDDLDVLIGLSGPSVDLDLRGVVRSLLNTEGLEVVVTLDSAFRHRLEAEEPELAAELEVVELPELDHRQLMEAGRARASELGRHHDVTISAPLIRAAAAPPAATDQLVHPGLLVTRLDHACVRARVRRASTVEHKDLDLGPEARTWAGLDPDGLATRLRARVVGQDDAVRRVCARLGLTTSGLDLNPHRPNGVFLLVGPTGVGKTELARSLTAEVFGGPDLLIRLDMSEYAEDWSMSRLFGPHPGYKGSDQPEGWLTSRVIDKPMSVVLLDEIEKAHPAVWNVFLQVFDDGRLTDSRGRTADFSDTVILMTSNLGARAFSENPVGFGEGDRGGADAAATAVSAAVTRELPPELVNRLDDVVVLRPLTEPDIHQIARRLVERACRRLREQRWEVEVDAEVVAHLAATGYDPAFGARHLQRSIERHLLAPLVGLRPGPYDASLTDDTVTWTRGSRRRGKRQA